MSHHFRLTGTWKDLAALCSAVLFGHQVFNSLQHPGIDADHMGDQLKENGLLYGVISEKIGCSPAEAAFFLNTFI